MRTQIFTNLSTQELSDLISQAVKDSIGSELNSHPEHKPEEELLSIEDISKIFRVSKVTIHKWKQKGLIPFYKMNRRVYFKKSEIVESLKNKKRKLEV
jgi:excisionase family DNA binding protein